MLCEHNDHLAVSSILMSGKIDQMDHGLALPHLSTLDSNFTEELVQVGVEGDEPDEAETEVKASEEDDSQEDSNDESVKTTSTEIETPKTSSPSKVDSALKKGTTVADLTKALVRFISSQKSQPLWHYEDITRTVWEIRSAKRIDIFLQHVLQVFAGSLPAHTRLAERWAQLALQLALSCSSRHYAGRSLQIFRALRVPITSRMLSDILSRLVETIAEQGEDMQGYVTEIMLTLESIVDALDSDIRPMDLARDIFKSTPNLKEESEQQARKLQQQHQMQIQQHQHQLSTSRPTADSPVSSSGHGYHISAPVGAGGPFANRYPYDRCVSYNVPPSGRQHQHHQGKLSLQSPIHHMRGRSSTDSEGGRGALGTGGPVPASSSALSRSRSAQSLKLQDQVRCSDTTFPFL